jgi:Icc-related predicted phosphoesterase
LSETKILFATDLHGGDTYFLKILSAAKSFKVNAVMMCGDLTGKAIVPIVKLDEDLYVTNFFGIDYRLKKEELPKLQNDIRKVGYYYYHCGRPEYEEMLAKPELVTQLFEKLMCQTIENWLAKIEEIVPKDMRVIMNPGNDDTFAIDGVLKSSKRIEYTLGRCIDLDETHSVVGCDWVNPTPWKSPRECDEKELEKRLRTEIQRAPSTENLICDFHAPPYNTVIDLAPRLGKNLQPQFSMGSPEMEHVGSTSVSKVLKEYQPKLALHGHIHESAGICNIKKTVCINPGSEYVEGVMHGVLLMLTPTGLDHQLIIGG